MQQRLKTYFSSHPHKSKLQWGSPRSRAAARKRDGGAAGGEVGTDQQDSCLAGQSHPSPERNQESPLGLKVLVTQPSEKKDAVDIVAIHGLNGHREKTWIDKTTGTNWLSDLNCLPKDITNARVLSFGYNSASYFSRGDSDIFDFASELLAALSSCRKSNTEKRRPVIFICHSLGGLVFKQAIVKAHNQDRFYPQLLDSIKAVLFFGTPHAGSDLAFWDSIGTRIARAASLGFSTNIKLSKDLQVNSNMLKNISESFAHRGWSLKIRSFYETELMPGLNCRVVEKQSATLGWGNELDIASPADHASLCKFPSRTDQRYQTVVSTLQDIIENFEPTVDESTTAKAENFLNVLNTDYEDHLGQIDDPVPETCEWVLSHENFKKWKSFLGHSLLWFTSNAGCGKSIIAKYIVNHLSIKEELNHTMYLGYFFFMDGLSGQDTASMAVSALLHQLCCSQEGLARQASKRVEGVPYHAWSDLSTLWRVLLDALNHTKAKELIWVLDGLDECEPTSLRYFMKALSALFETTDSSLGTASKVHVKILMLSRPSSIIQQILGLYTEQKSNVTFQTNKIRLIGEDENQSLLDDIRRFARWKIDELSQSSALPKDILDQMNKRLVGAADFTFLWISLVFKLVEDATLDGISIQQVIEILNTTNLDDVYVRLLTGASKIHPDKTRKLLSLVLAAIRPLTVSEMCIAIEVDEDIDPLQHLSSSKTSSKANWKAKGEKLPSHWKESSSNLCQANTLDTLNLKLRRPFDNHLRQLCGHFVRIRRGRVYFVHQTARSFITRESFSLDWGETRKLKSTLNGLDNQWQPITFEDANWTMLRVCVNYIKMSAMELEDNDHLSWSDEQVLSYLAACRQDPRRAFFHYAALNWVRHYRPLRRQLDSQYDDLLQPGSKLFHEMNTHGKFKRTNVLDVKRLRKRYENLYLWALKRSELYQDPMSDELQEKFMDVHRALKRIEKNEANDYYSTRQVYTNVGQGGKEKVDELEHTLALIKALEEKRDRSFEEDPYLNELVTHTMVNIRQKRSYLDKPIQEEINKEGDINEILLYFGLFRLEEADLDEDDFLKPYFQAQLEMDSENCTESPLRESEDEEGDQVEDIDGNIPNWVRRYIRESMAEKKLVSIGSPGVDVPELSNPGAIYSFRGL